MSTVTVVVGKRHIPLDHIALVEPFDPAAHPGMKTEKAFKARIVLIDRQSVLTEDTAEAFAAAHAFRILVEDQVMTNPSIRFGVERFEAAKGFEPTKPFQTRRLSWRDLDGNTQSKLLLSKPDDVLAIAVTGDAAAGNAPEKPSDAGGRKRTAASDRRKARRREQQPEPA